jgi:hypothetical protein
VSLVNPSGGSCGRTDALLGEDRFWPRFAPLRTALRHDVRPRGAVGLRTALRRMARRRIGCALHTAFAASRPGRFAPAAARARRRLPGAARLRSALHASRTGRVHHSRASRGQRPIAAMRWTPPADGSPDPFLTTHSAKYYTHCLIRKVSLKHHAGRASVDSCARLKPVCCGAIAKLFLPPPTCSECFILMS